MLEQILQTKNLSKMYGSCSAVHNLNFSLQRGNIYGLVGKLTVPTAGELELFGQTSEAGLNHARLRTGCMIESPSFFPNLSAAENLEYYRIQKDMPEKDVREALHFVGLADTEKKQFRNFSMGMKQRLGLALAIMKEPELLLLDEPINGLDPMGIAEFRDIISNLNRKYGTTVLISSHILGELSQIATVYGFINQGNLVEQVAAKELSEKCRRRLSVKVDDTAKAAYILKDELSCMEYEIESDRILVEKYMDTPEVLNEALVKNGVQVSELTTAGLSLEQYFINLVGGK